MMNFIEMKTLAMAVMGGCGWWWVEVCGDDRR